MQPLWPGWVCPEGETGRGRGSRAFLQRSKTGVILHDASYWCPFLLSGAFNDVIGVLEKVLDPVVASQVAAEAEDSLKEGCGWEIQGVLYEPSAGNPHGGGAITDVRIMKMARKRIDSDDQIGAEFTSSVKNHLELCIWAHGAAAAQALIALKTASEERKSPTADGVGSVEVKVLDMRRIELRGGGVDKCISQALFRESNNKENPRLFASRLSRLAPGEAAKVTILDPRLSAPMTLGSSTFSVYNAGLNTSESIHANNNLFDSTPHPLPISEANISQIRQDARRRTVLGGDFYPASAFSLPVRNQSETSSVSCTAVFIRQSCRFSGWSILLPPGWVAPVWQALVFSGARAAGQREWRWLHTLDLRPFFPHDAPDTAAYARLMLNTAEKQKEMEKTRPKGKLSLSKEFKWAWIHTLREDHLDDAENNIRKEILEWLGSKLLDTPAKQYGGEAQATTVLVAANSLEEEAMQVDDAEHRKVEPVAKENKEVWAPIFVARSEESMIRTVFGQTARGDGPVCSGSSARPVFNALASGRLRWAPRHVAVPAPAPNSSSLEESSPLCLVQTQVEIIKRGTISDGAMICVIRGEEAERSSLPKYITIIGNRVDAAATNVETQDYEQPEECSLEQIEIFEETHADLPAEKIIPIGFITSSAPSGTGRTSVSLAACSAAAFWRLRSLQYYEPLRDRGTVHAWIVNPGSTAVFPVRLSLQVERKR